MRKQLEENSQKMNKQNEGNFIKLVELIKKRDIRK